MKMFSKKFKILWGIILSLLIAISITLGVICIFHQQWISLATSFINTATFTYLMIFMLCN
jgi:hypothetical protein